MKRIIDLLKRQPLLTAVLAIATAVGGLLLLKFDDCLRAGYVRMLLAIAMLFFLYLISGGKAINKSGEQIGYVIGMMKGYLIYAAVTGLAGFYLVFSGERPLAEKWPLTLLAGAFEMFFVGLFEELAFRAVASDGILYQFRNFKGVFVLIGLATPLLFGFMHVLGSAGGTPLLLAQALLKVLSAGLLGFAMLMMYWKTRDILACAIVHFLYDFMIASSSLMCGASLQGMGGYVMEGNAGIAVIVIQSVNTVISLLLMIRIWKKVMKTIDFEEMRKTW